MPNLRRKAIPFLVIGSFVLMAALMPDLLVGKIEPLLEPILGRYWWVILIIIFLLLFGLVIKYKPTLLGGLLPDGDATQSTTPPRSTTDFYPAIKTYLTTRYTNRLQQKLANRQPVNLRRLPFNFGKAGNGDGIFMEYKGDEIKEELAQNFEDANGRLLLLGDPGTGKTTLLLQLALKLTESRPESVTAVLNLATWTNEYPDLAAWLEKILPAELGVNKTLAAQILTDNRLILLFDGFDEIKEDSRRACIKAIGEYGMRRERQYVISSRKKEYLDVANDAPVYFPIEVGLLKPEQIEADLERMAHKEPEAKRLLAAIRQDPHLRAAVQTPFFLNTLQLLFAKSKSWVDFDFKADSLEGRKEEIKLRFVEDKLSKPSEQAKKPDEAKEWLAFWASRLEQRNLVVFELRDLQYDWWVWTRMQKIGIGLVFGLVLGLVLGLVGGLVLGLVFGVVVGLVFGVVFGVVFGLAVGLVLGLVGGLKENIYWIATKDEPKWSIRNYLFQLRKNWIGGVVVGVVFGVVAGVAGIAGVAGVADGLVVGLGSGLVFGLVTALLNMLEKNHTNLLQITHPYQRFYASMKSLHFSILQHRHLCRLLTREGLLPPNLVDFLNEMTERHLLESDGAVFDGDGKIVKSGATWRFRHRILQEHFAGLWKEEEKKRLNAGLHP